MELSNVWTEKPNLGCTLKAVSVTLQTVNFRNVKLIPLRGFISLNGPLGADVYEDIETFMCSVLKITVYMKKPRKAKRAHSLTGENI